MLNVHMIWAPCCVLAILIFTMGAVKGCDSVYVKSEYAKRCPCAAGNQGSAPDSLQQAKECQPAKK